MFKWVLNTGYQIYPTRHTLHYYMAPDPWSSAPGTDILEKFIAFLQT